MTATLALCPGDLSVIGHCPCCHNPVLSTEEEVWTCPADLSEGNPDREESNSEITEDLREEHGVFSNCGNDFGFSCYEDMPLHAACYENGNY